MATKKKTDETENTVEAEAGSEAVEAAEVKADAAEEAGSEAVETAEVKADAAAEAPKARAKNASKKSAKSTEPTADSTGETEKKGKRAEKIGVVTSDKMMMTVVVRVDRLVKHPIYRKYVRKRKKFMAHDEKGAKIGDKVRIVETRPLSARKRWRVVEIIQKAEL
jgi:small subunit ribosomal protein S17